MATVPAEQPEIEKALGAADVARILGAHRRTAERRRPAGQRPRPLEAQRADKLERVWKQLLGLYTPENAVKWLRSFVPALGGQRPVDVMTEDGGLDRVLETLCRMSGGIPG